MAAPPGPTMSCAARAFHSRTLAPLVIAEADMSFRHGSGSGCDEQRAHRGDDSNAPVHNGLLFEGHAPVFNGAQATQLGPGASMA